MVDMPSHIEGHIMFRVPAANLLPSSVLTLFAVENSPLRLAKSFYLV